MISSEDLQAFDRTYYGTKPQHQRYGQALLNHFNDDPDVSKHRSDSILWEAKTKHVALLRAQELNIIGWEQPQ